MWPGEQQPGGQQNPQGPAPQGPNPQSANAFGPPPAPGPAPYGPAPQGAVPPGQAPHGHPQTPGYPPPQYGYPQHHGYGQPQQAPWGTPGIPPGAPRPSGRRGLIAGVSVLAAVVLVAAGVTALLLNRNSDNKPVASASSAAAQSSPAAAPGSGAPGSGDGMGDLHGGGDTTVKPVVPGWQAVPRGEIGVAFDVPRDWKLDPQSTDMGFEDEKGNPAVIMGAPAEEKNFSCGGNSQAAAGTHRARNAKSLQNAAEVDAAAWVYYGFNDLKKGTKGTLHAGKAVPFTNSHGIKGYAASATETGEPKNDKCSTDGAAYTVAWTGANNELTVWVLYTATGVPGEVSAQTVETMEQSIRQLP